MLHTVLRHALNTCRGLQTLADVLRQRGCAPPASDVEDLDLRDLVCFAKERETRREIARAIRELECPSTPSDRSASQHVSFFSTLSVPAA